MTQIGTAKGTAGIAITRFLNRLGIVSKLGIALQELEESSYWLELLAKSKVIPANRLSDLRKETDELIAIFVSSTNTAKLKK